MVMAPISMVITTAAMVTVGITTVAMVTVGITTVAMVTVGITTVAMVTVGAPCMLDVLRCFVRLADLRHALAFRLSGFDVRIFALLVT